MGLSINTPGQILTSKLSNILVISILLFYKIFFFNELRDKFLSSLKQKSVKNSEYIFSEVRESVVAATLEIICQGFTGSSGALLKSGIFVVNARWSKE